MGCSLVSLPRGSHSRWGTGGTEVGGGVRVFRGEAILGGRSCLWEAPGHGQSTQEALTSSGVVSRQDGAAENAIVLDS